MTFGQSIATCFMKYADFNGRASRPEYWWFFLFNCLAAMIAGAMSEVFGSVVQLAFLLPALAVGARRLHDTDRSGWLLLLWLIPIVGWIIVIVFLAQEAKEPNRYGATAQ